MRVCPPTRTTSSILLVSTCASASAFLQGSIERCNQIIHQLLQLGTSQLLDQVLRTGRIRRDEGQD